MGHYSNTSNIGISFLQDPGKFQRSGQGYIISDAWDQYRFQKSVIKTSEAKLKRS
jgi:hypothetical protein